MKPRSEQEVVAQLKKILDACLDGGPLMLIWYRAALSALAQMEEWHAAANQKPSFKALLLRVDSRTEFLVSPGNVARKRRAVPTFQSCQT
jgi:hypothetical protein